MVNASSTQNLESSVSPKVSDHFSSALGWRNLAKKCYASGDNEGYRAAVSTARYHEARLSDDQRLQYRKAMR